MKRKHIEVRVVLHFEHPDGENVTFDDAQAALEAQLASVSHKCLTGCSVNTVYDRSVATPEMIDAALKANGVAADDVQGKAAVETALASALDKMP